MYSLKACCVVRLYKLLDTETDKQYHFYLNLNLIVNSKDSSCIFFFFLMMLVIECLINDHLFNC